MACPTFTTISELVAEAVPCVQALAEKCKRQRLATRVDVAGNRVVVSANRKYCSLDHPLYRESNGVVIAVSSDTARVVAYPQPMLNYRPKLKAVRACWNEYQQWRIVDGTSLTLYYHNDKWCLSSANGYDVSAMMWMGITYGNAFRELLHAHNVDISRINRARNYHLLMRHHTMQPLTSDPQGLWLLQVSECEHPLTDADDELERKIPRLHPLERRMSYKQVMEANARAITDYTRSGTAPNYGFVLRATRDLGAETHVLLESALMARIRNYVYAAPAGRRNIEHYDQKKYMLLRAYLNYTARNNFLRLFPQYNSYFSKFNSLFNSVVNRTMHAMRNKNVRTNIIEKATGTCDEIVRVVLQAIERMETINVYDENSMSILHDVIVDAKHILPYYQIIHARTVATA